MEPFRTALTTMLSPWHTCALLGTSLLLPLSAHSTEVSFRTNQSVTGVVLIPVYTFGHCRFQCVTPAGWIVNTNPGGNAAVKFTDPGSNSASISISVDTVSLAERDFAAWRIPDLKREITTNRLFTIEGESYIQARKGTCWQVWGSVVTNPKTSPRTVRMPPAMEYHAYFVAHGYLIHVQFRAPKTNDEANTRAFLQVRSSLYPLGSDEN